MTNDYRLIVYFACLQCSTLYAASQEEQPKKCSGAFHCGRCATPIHKWTGLYDYRDWTQVALRTRKGGPPKRRR